MRSLLRYSLVAAAIGALVLLSIATLTRQIEQKAYAQNTSGAVLVISSFRENGPGGTTDEFVEIFNPSNTSVTASSLSVDPGGTGLGIGVFAGKGPTSSSAKVDLKCRIDGSVVIPGRGHYLCIGSGYSLAGLGGNITSGHPGDATIGTDGAVPGDIPDDAGLALLPFGSDIVVACTIGDAGCNGGFAASGVAVFSVLDKVGFSAYGPGAPPPGAASPAANLSGNYCEGTCLRPIGDASNIPGAFGDCAGVSTSDFPTTFGAPGLGRCYGMSGQYKIERRRTNFDAAKGQISRDTNVNADDFLFVAPNPGINVGTNVTGITGVVPVLGSAAPYGLTRLPATPAPITIGRTVFEQNPFDSTQAQLGPRNAERTYGQDPILAAGNNPLGAFVLRMAFFNRGTSTITGGVFRINDLSTLCGPQTGSVGQTSTTGTGEARNLSPTPTCGAGTGAGAFTAVLKSINTKAELVVDGGNTVRTVNGTVLEDTNAAGVTTPPGVAPLGGGIDTTLGVNTSFDEVSRGDGVRGGAGAYTALTRSPSASTPLRVSFKFGVVKSGRFILLVQPETSGATPVP